MGSLGNISTQVTTYAAHGAASAWVIAGNFLALLILTLVMIGFSYKSGRGRHHLPHRRLLCRLRHLPRLSVYEQHRQRWGLAPHKGGISIVIFIICTFLPFHFIQRLVGSGFGVLSFVPRFALSFLAAAFLMSLAYHVFHVSNIYTFPEPINTLFAPNDYFFWWFIAPMAGLLFFVH